jgi:hypothetical protein
MRTILRQRSILIFANMTMQVSQDEKLSTKQTVDEDRKHAVEASIVRVMKARKTMPHQQLVMEVSGQLMKLFKPDPKVIKNRIESLISREVPFACFQGCYLAGLGYPCNPSCAWGFKSHISVT